MEVSELLPHKSFIYCIKVNFCFIWEKYNVDPHLNFWADPV